MEDLLIQYDGFGDMLKVTHEIDDDLLTIILTSDYDDSGDYDEVSFDLYRCYAIELIKVIKNHYNIDNNELN